jgi:hypothetical protein
MRMLQWELWRVRVLYEERARPGAGAARGGRTGWGVRVGSACREGAARPCHAAARRRKFGTTRLSADTAQGRGGRDWLPGPHPCQRGCREHTRPCAPRPLHLAMGSWPLLCNFTCWLFLSQACGMLLACKP